MQKLFSSISSKVAGAVGSPYAFIVAAGVIIVWAALGPLVGFSSVWQLAVNTGTTIITFLMLFILQHSQNKDGAAIQAKLDELIRGTKGAEDDFVGIDHLPADEVEAFRARCREAVKRQHP